MQDLDLELAAGGRHPFGDHVGAAVDGVEALGKLEAQRHLMVGRSAARARGCNGARGNAGTGFSQNERRSILSP